MKINSSNILSSIIIVTIITLVIFPLYIIFFVEPAFTQFIIGNTEKDAAKLGTYLSNSFFPNSIPVDKSSISDRTIKELSRLQNDFTIIKIKVFNSHGEIIHSSNARDIGTVNTRDYFHNIVARGELYTKIVQKDKTSLEGKTMPVDVVEVYVPIMQKEQFAGAFEIYYDITEKHLELSGHLSQMTKLTLLLSFILLGAVIWAAIQANRSIKACQIAEDNLLHAHNNLEKRVMERTKELTKVNDTLEKEISVRKQTEIEKEQLINDLRSALEKVKTLSGLLPICSSCQQIRDSDGKWSKVDEYIQTRTDAEFTHGICPNCAKKLYPDLYDELTIEP